MQLKLYKKSTILLALVITIDIVAIFFLLNYLKSDNANKFLAIIAFIAFIFILYFIYSYYDLYADRNLIKKAVSNGDVALAKIKDGTFVRFARDSRLTNHVYWELNVEIYDNDMKKIDTSIIEKFSTHQTSIPKGYVYVTYLQDKPEDSLIIPNVIISSIAEYKPLVDEYEKKIKPKYLNAYINKGLILQTYKDSIKQ